MTFEELDALLDAGDVAAVEVALAGASRRDGTKRLSGEQAQIIERKLARVKILQAPPPPARKARVEAPAEEPAPVQDSEPEPKAEPKARRSSPAGRGKKG